jgi:hypothetical protein
MPLTITSLILLIVCFFSWDDIIKNIEILGTLATALAFFATAWAAFEARSSAKAAMIAVNLTKDSLLESRKAAFNQWFAILLEKNENMQGDITTYLEKDPDIKKQLEVHLHLNQFYRKVIKESLFSAYINNLYHVLNYVDNEYYGKPDDIDGKKKYMEQLSNSMTNSVKVIVAIFGLNYAPLSHVKKEKLGILLKKYNFFEHDLFFDAAIEQREYLDHFINRKFIEEYRNINFTNIMAQIQHGEFECNVFLKSRGETPNTLFALLYTYNPMARKYIDNFFAKYTEHTKNEIIIKIKEARKEHSSNLNSFYLKDYAVTRKGKIIITRQRTINTKGDIISLLRHYMKLNKKFGSAITRVQKIEFLNTTWTHIRRDGNSYLDIIDIYLFTFSLVKLKRDPEQEAKIEKLVTFANEVMIEHWEALKSL